MYKIHVGARLDPAQWRCFALNRQRVPPHMGNLQTGDRSIGPRRSVSGWKSLHFPRHDLEPLVDAELLALAEQQLEPETDTQEWFAGRDRAVDRFDQSIPFQIRHTVSKCAHARQHDVTGIVYCLRRSCDHRLVPDNLEGLLDTPEVAHAVIDDGDHSRPFLVKRISFRTSSASRFTNDARRA